jgi:hypothetical protein
MRRIQFIALSRFPVDDFVAISGARVFWVGHFGVLAMGRIYVYDCVVCDTHWIKRKASGGAGLTLVCNNLARIQKNLWFF